MKLFSLALSAALAAGCASTPAPAPMAYDYDTGARANASLSYSVWIDPAMDPAYQDLIVRGFADWSTWVPALKAAPTIGACPSTGDHVICLHVADDTETAAQPAGMLGLTTYVRPDVGSTSIALYASRWTLPGMDVAATEHEIGHAFGLVHVGPGELMSPDFNIGAHEITEDDVAQFWSLRGSDPAVQSLHLLSGK